MFAKMSLAFKIMALCTSFLIPTSFLMYLVVSAYGKDINFAANEDLGTVYLKHVHTGLTAANVAYFADKADPSFSKAIDELVEAKNRLVDQLPAVEKDLRMSEAEMASRGRSGNTITALNEKINQFVTALNGADAAATDKAYNALVAQLNVLIVHIGDTSNLILDPDLDSYYLMDAFLVALPTLENRLATIQTFEKSLASKKELSFDERMNAKTFAALIRDVDLARVTADLDTALNEDKNFYGSNSRLQKEVDDLRKTLVADIEPLVAALEQQAATGQVGVESKTQIITKIRSSASELWSVSAVTMSELLNARMDSYKGHQRMSLIVSVLALVALFFMGILVVRKMVSRLSALAATVTTQSNQVANASEAINTAADDLSKSTTSQSAAIEETVASSEEMTAMLAQTTQSADHSLQVSRQSLDKAASGREVMARLGQAMEAIESSNGKLQNLIDVIAGIQSKTKVINEIVFETRLLSVNASIEAARAGAHGKGFAVVAEEVGKLAAMSGKAANEINELLANSSSQVKSIVDETKDRVTSGVHVAQEAAADFAAISDLLGGITDAVEKISSATREQEIGIKQTNQAMTEMDQITQQNSINASNLSSESVKLNEYSVELRSAINEVVTILYGTNNQPASMQTEQLQKAEPRILPTKNKQKARKNDQSTKHAA